MPDEQPKPKRTRKPKTTSGATKEGRRGHNGGGLLKSGNTVGVGRKPADVRGEILQTVGDASGLMRSILDGSFRQPVYDMGGKIAGHRGATITEIVKVYDALAKHALPNKTEVSGPDGGPLDVVSRPDLSGLSVAEKEQMLTLAEKAEASRQERNPE